MRKEMQTRLSAAEKGVDYLENCIPIISACPEDPNYGKVMIDGREATPDEVVELERRGNTPVMSYLAGANDMRSDESKAEDELFLSSRNGVRRATPAEAAEVKARGMIPIRTSIPHLPLPGAQHEIQ